MGSQGRCVCDMKKNFSKFPSRNFLVSRLHEEDAHRHKHGEVTLHYTLLCSILLYSTLL